MLFLHLTPTATSNLNGTLVNGKFTAVLGAGKNVAAAATESYRIVSPKLQCRVSCDSGL